VLRASGTDLDATPVGEATSARPAVDGFKREPRSRVRGSGARAPSDDVTSKAVFA
jgi:hypothetical protein